MHDHVKTPIEVLVPSPRPWVQRPTGSLISRPDRERPTLNGWRAPITLRCIKRVGAAGSRHEVRLQPHTPPTFPSPIYKEPSSDGKLRRRCRRCVDRRCPSANVHFVSLPKRISPTWLADPAAPLSEMVTHSSPISQSFQHIHASQINTYTVTQLIYPTRSAPR
jgi:hypothetical protein